jgi:hypothetical protein
VISRRFKTKDPGVIDATYAEFKRLMPLDAAPSVEGAKNVIANLRQTDVKVASEKVEDYIDASVINGMRTKVLAELKKKYGIK